MRGFGGFAQGLSQGIMSGIQLSDAIKKGQMQEEMAKVQEGKAQENYTAADGQQLEAMANAKDQDGNAFYTIGTTADGKYTVTPNMPGEGSEVGKAITIPQGGVTFLGQSYDKPLSAAEVARKRDEAMIGVMKKYGDMQGAMSLQRQMRQDDQAEVTNARDAKRFEWESADAERKQADAARQAELKAKLQEWDTNSPMAQAQAKYQSELEAYNKSQQAWQANYDAGDRGAKLGEQPVAPTKPTFNYLDQLHHNASRLAYRSSLGDYDPQAMLGVSKALEDVKKEGTLEAARALQAGDRDGAVRAFNRTGLQLDQKDIVEFGKAKVNIGGAPVDTHFIKVRGPDGEVRTYNAAQILNQFDATDKLVNQYYAGRADQRGQASLGLQQQAFEDQKREREDLRTARGDLFKAENPTASAQQVRGAALGILPVVEPLDGLKPEVRHDPMTGSTTIVQGDKRGNVSVTNIGRNGETTSSFTLPRGAKMPAKPGTPAAAAAANGAGIAAPVAERPSGAIEAPGGESDVRKALKEGRVIRFRGGDGATYVTKPDGSYEPVEPMQTGPQGGGQQPTGAPPSKQPAAAPKGMNETEKAARIGALQEKLTQAQAMLAAASKSGDKATVQRNYVEPVLALEAQIRALQS